MFAVRFCADGVLPAAHPTINATEDYAHADLYRTRP